MARRRVKKTDYTREEWQEIFAKAAKICSKLANEGKVNFRECMRNPELVVKEYEDLLR